MKNRILRIFYVLAALVVAAGIPAAYADPVTLTLMLSDGTNTVTVMDGTAQDANSTAGVVEYKGGIGAWNIDVSTGEGSGVLGPGRLDLNSVNTSSLGTGSTLTIELTQTGMTTDFSGWQMTFGGTATNISSLAYSAYADTTDTPFGTGISIGTVGPFITSPFSGTVVNTSVNLAGATYSLTQEIQITGIAGMRNTFSGNAQISPVPEPGPVMLLGFGLLGLLTIRRRFLLQG